MKVSISEKNVARKIMPAKTVAEKLGNLVPFEVQR